MDKTILNIFFMFSDYLIFYVFPFSTCIVYTEKKMLLNQYATELVTYLLVLVVYFYELI